MSDKFSYQLDLDAAKFYETHFVPTIFKNWSEILLDKTPLKFSDKLLDVACGTGIVARQARKRELHIDNIYGIDLNQGMIKVAEELAPGINWVQGSADEMTFENDFFDKVVCQFGLMFFPKKVNALNELNRVRKKDGKIIMGIWNSLEENEAYYDLLELVEEVLDSETAEILKAPFKLGKKEDICELIEQSELTNYNIETVISEIQFPSIKYWIDCDIKASTIANSISDEQYKMLLSRGQNKLSKYIPNEDFVNIKMSAHLVSCN